MFDAAPARYSFVAARPFLTFRSAGSRCEITPHFPAAPSQLQFGNPWHLLDSLMARCELLDEIDLPFPLGGCFGYWGYELKNFVEPKLARRALNDLELPDCHVGFYDSLVAFDHHLGKSWIISTGLRPDGTRDAEFARQQLDFWQRQLAAAETESSPPRRAMVGTPAVASNFSRAEFLTAVQRAQDYIRRGHIFRSD
jgi:anthranilate/para-aminobenzoate synthase component I